MNDTTALQVYEPLSIEQMKGQVNLIQHVMKEVMKENEHYGVIPGCGNKPTLLKPGAEKLSMTFRMAPKYTVTQTDHPNGHREYQVVCTLTHITSGQTLGEGLGVCSTMEAKYRFRTGEVESTGKAVPKEYWVDRDQKLIGGKGFGTKKVDGKWEIARMGERVEHDNPADYYNTVIKMAKKRAHVDAVLTATAASDIFTQDIEDMDLGKKEQKPTPKAEEKTHKPEQPSNNGNGSEPTQRENGATSKQRNSIKIKCNKLDISTERLDEIIAEQTINFPEIETAETLTKSGASAVIGVLQVLEDEYKEAASV